MSAGAYAIKPGKYIKKIMTNYKKKKLKLYFNVRC